MFVKTLAERQSRKSLIYHIKGGKLVFLSWGVAAVTAAYENNPPGFQFCTCLPPALEKHRPGFLIFHLDVHEGHRGQEEGKKIHEVFPIFLKARLNSYTYP